MQTSKHTPEQIVAKLRQAELELAKGRTIPQVSQLLGITEQTYYRWRKEFGGLRLDQAKRLKQLEQENTRLKKVVADLTLDNAMLKEVADPHFFRRHGGIRRTLVGELPCAFSAHAPIFGEVRRKSSLISKGRRSAQQQTEVRC